MVTPVEKSAKINTLYSPHILEFGGLMIACLQLGSSAMRRFNQIIDYRYCFQIGR